MRYTLNKTNWYLAHGFVKLKDTEEGYVLQKIFPNGDFIEIDVDEDYIHTSELFIKTSETTSDGIVIGECYGRPYMTSTEYAKRINEILDKIEQNENKNVNSLD